MTIRKWLIIHYALAVIMVFGLVQCASPSLTQSQYNDGWVSLGGGLQSREVDAHTTCYRLALSAGASLSCVDH